MLSRHKTVGVKVGDIMVGGGAPVVVQSMTNTDTVDVASTVQQCLELAQAGSELVRLTVDRDEAAVRRRYSDSGVVTSRSGGDRRMAARSAAGVSPVRTATDSSGALRPNRPASSSIPAKGIWRFSCTSVARARSGDT